jgi:acyl-coenzyme A synthetase/AMP-(fatty) acid ligase
MALAGGLIAVDIRQLIRRLFDGGVAVFHDAQGEPVAPDRVRAEYAAIKNYLLSHLPRSEIVAIRLAYDYRYLLAIYACMEVGLPYLPLRLRWPESRVGQITRLSGCRFVVDENNIEELCGCQEAPGRDSFDASPEAPLYVMYTSGTTGEPKGVVIQRRAYENFLRWIAAEVPRGPGCRILFVADFTFDMSLLDIGLFLLKQGQCFFSQFDGNLFRLAYEIEAWEIESIATVPNNINLLLQDNIYDRSDFHSLKQLLLGGSRFSYGTYKSIFGRLPNLETVLNLYGPTEVTVYCHYKRLSGREPGEVLDANVSIGRVAPGLTCVILDDDGCPVTEPDRRGELLVGGVQVMQGYLGDPGRAAQSLVQLGGGTYYRTGDVAFRSAGGDYYITGRKDDTLKRRGYRVNLLDIDSYIQRLDAVQDCATVAIPDPDTDHLLVTYVVPRTRLAEDVLRQRMAEVLVDYQVPDHVVYVDGFPTNNSGKVDRDTLRRMFERGLRRAS